MTTQLQATPARVSLDPQLYIAFKNSWKEIQPTALRFGQYFHQYFDLEKSTAYKTEYDKLYQLDGDLALAKIRELFEI